MVFQADVGAVTAQPARLGHLDEALHAQVNAGRLHPVVAALQALRGVPCTGAVTTVAELGARTRVDHPRPLRTCVGLMPSASSSGARRRQGALTKAGNPHARRALVEGAGAYRDPATVSRHRQRRLERQPQAIHDISGTAQGRLCTCVRRLMARGKHATPVVVAMARDLVGFMWAMATQVPVTPSGH